MKKFYVLVNNRWHRYSYAIKMNLKWSKMLTDKEYRQLKQTGELS